MRIICDCGSEMVANEYSSDREEHYGAQFECETCGAIVETLFWQDAADVPPGYGMQVGKVEPL